MQSGDRRLASQHQAGNLGLRADLLCEKLIRADAGPDTAAAFQRRSREQVAGLCAVDAALAGLGVIEAADEEHFVLELLQRLKHLAQLQVAAFAFGPPLLAVKAVAGEQHRQTHRRR